MSAVLEAPRNRRHWHRALGAFGAALAVLLVVTGTIASIDSLR